MRRNLILITMALALVAAACSADTSDMTMGVAAEAPAATVAAETAAEVAAGAAADVADAVAAAEEVDGALQAVALGRSIIFEADMRVSVDDVEVATDEAIRLVGRLGGILFGQQSVGLPEPASTLTFRVTPDRFQEALDALATLGTVQTQKVTADDVTERVVDLESRIATAEVSVERLRTLIAGATDLEDITALENQLLARETTLETLRGQLRTVQDRVDLATITVTLTEALARPGLDLTVTAYPGTDDAGASCPGDPGLSVEEGTPATVCFELTNVGDTPLTGITLSDTVLEFADEDLIAVFGSTDDILEPGQFIILAAEVAPERTLRTRTRATATPVNVDGRPLEARAVAATTSVVLEAIDPGGLPGFGDGVAVSWSVITTVRDVLVLVAGLALPLLWIPPLFIVIRRWIRRRQEPPPTPSEA